MPNCARISSIVLLVIAFMIGIFALAFPGWLGGTWEAWWNVEVDTWYGLWYFCVGDEFDDDHCKEHDIDFGDDDQAEMNAVRVCDAAGVAFMLLAIIVSCCSAIAQAIFCFLAFLAQGAAVVIFGIDAEEVSDYFHVSFYGCCVSSILCLAAGCMAICGRRKY